MAAGRRGGIMLADPLQLAMCCARWRRRSQALNGGHRPAYDAICDLSSCEWPPRPVEDKRSLVSMQMFNCLRQSQRKFDPCRPPSFYLPLLALFSPVAACRVPADPREWPPA